MTIIVGMLSRDGIVMGADSEESTTDLKKSVQKLFPLRTSDGSYLIAGGAGPGYLVDAITQELWKDFLPASFENILQIQQEIADRVHRFYKEHVLAWPTIQEREANDFSLLLGVSVRSEKSDNYAHYLWIVEKGVLRPAGPSAAIGMGAMYANILMDNLHGFYSAASTSLIAIDTIRRVKRDTPWCGKDTSIWCVKNGRWVSILDDRIERAEKLLQKFEDATTRQFLETVIFDGPGDQREEFVSLRKDFRKLISEFGC
ncbi:MAG TPA: hypothetical protein VLY23_08350 [Candidatus Acidoferrum sp.]|nr:hypothetical protein [Candidatus Acidoferrum sp.]